MLKCQHSDHTNSGHIQPQSSGGTTLALVSLRPRSTPFEAALFSLIIHDGVVLQKVRIHINGVVTHQMVQTCV